MIEDFVKSISKIDVVLGIIQFGSSIIENDETPNDVDFLIIYLPQTEKRLRSALRIKFVDSPFIEYEYKILLFPKSEISFDIHLSDNLSSHLHLLKETLSHVSPEKIIKFDRTGTLLTQIKTNGVSYAKLRSYHTNRTIECYLLALNNLRKFDFYSAEFHLSLVKKHLLTLCQPQESFKRDYLPKNAYDNIEDPTDRQTLLDFDPQISPKTAIKKMQDIFDILRRIIPSQTAIYSQIIHPRLESLADTWFEICLQNMTKSISHPKQILIVGMGYMGMVSGLGLSLLGHQITFTDIDKNKIRILKSGNIPIYENGMELVVKKLKTIQNFPKALEINSIQTMKPDAVLLCVGTPSLDDGSTDLTQLKQAIELVSPIISNGCKNVVIRSTVPPTTCEKTIIPLLEKITMRTHPEEFTLSMVPEFLREGNGFFDFLFPDRVVIGANDSFSLNTVKEIFELRSPFHECSLTDAELIKYMANSFLATKISFINEISSIIERLSVNSIVSFDCVKQGFVMDQRINPLFFNPGLGFGGSCFQKDVFSLIWLFKTQKEKTHILPAVIKTNMNQRYWPIRVLSSLFQTFENKIIAIFGLTFKPGTDDVRNAPAITISKELISRGCIVRGYDPEGNAKAKDSYPPEMLICDSIIEATEDADAILIATEWDEFREFSPKHFSPTAKKLLLDGRRIIDRSLFQDWEIYVIGG